MILAMAGFAGQTMGMDRIPRTGFPEVFITHNQVVPDPLLKDDKLNASMVIVNSGGSNFPPEHLYNGFITKKGRGNTTWTLDKKPYNITTTNSSYAKQNTTLFGWPADSEFSLMADAQDKTYLRTLLGTALSKALGTPWVPRFQKVRVYIDNVYQGLYTIEEKIKDGPNRVDIHKVSATDLAAPGVTGDYMVEHLASYQIDSTEVSYSFTDDFGNSYLGKIPDPDKYKPAQITYVRDYINSYQNAVFNVSFNDLTNGYRAFMDPLSVVRAAQLSDILKTGDGMWSNDYYVKTRNGLLSRYNMWDFGGALATSPATNYRGTLADSISLTDPNGEWINLIVPEIEKLMTDPYFYSLYQQNLKSAVWKIKRIIKDAKHYIKDPAFLQEVADDRSRWPALVTDEAYIPRGSYMNEVNFTLSFFENRLNYFINTYLN